MTFRDELDSWFLVQNSINGRRQLLPRREVRGSQKAGVKTYFKKCKNMFTGLLFGKLQCFYSSIFIFFFTKIQL